MNFTVHFEGDTEFIYAIKEFDGLITDWKKVWPLFARIFYDIERQQFASEGARGPQGQWKPLSDGYNKWKKRNFGDLPILVLTGAMKESLLGSGPDTIKIETPTALLLGTRVNRKGFYYPAAHQKGAGKLPRRKPIDLRRDDYGKFVSRIFRYFNDGVEEIGFRPKRGAGIRSIQAS